MCISLKPETESIKLVLIHHMMIVEFIILLKKTLKIHEIRITILIKFYIAK